MKQNIPIIFANGALMWARFFVPVIALFYIASQVTLEQFGIIMAVFAIVTLLFEIPSGVVADMIGKKNSLLIARFMYLIEIAILAFGNGFELFLIAKIISGIAVSLVSGTSQALLYDTLKRLKRTNEHKKISGALTAVTNISMAIIFIVGAYLFTIDAKLPAILSLPFIGLGFILTFFLEEPYPPKRHINIKSYLLHLKEGLLLFFRRSEVKFMTFLFPKNGLRCFSTFC